VRLRISKVAAVLEAHRAFEPQTAQLASLFGTETEFRLLRSTIEAQLAALGNRERINQFEERFHLYMARATGNPTIVRDHSLEKRHPSLHARMVAGGPLRAYRSDRRPCHQPAPEIS
jgi:DNA-binding FadR family transcriptional regulator